MFKFAVFQRMEKTQYCTFKMIEYYDVKVEKHFLMLFIG